MALITPQLWLNQEIIGELELGEYVPVEDSEDSEEVEEEAEEQEQEEEREAAAGLPPAEDTTEELLEGLESMDALLSSEDDDDAGGTPAVRCIGHLLQLPCCNFHAAPPCCNFRAATSVLQQSCCNQ